MAEAKTTQDTSADDASTPKKLKDWHSAKKKKQGPWTYAAKFGDMMSDWDTQLRVQRHRETGEWRRVKPNQWPDEATEAFKTRYGNRASMLPAPGRPGTRPDYVDVATPPKPVQDDREKEMRNVMERLERFTISQESAQVNEAKLRNLTRELEQTKRENTRLKKSSCGAYRGKKSNSTTQTTTRRSTA